MTAKEVLELLSEEDITTLLLHLGSAYPVKVNGVLTFTTICHNGDSHKLYYYSSNKKFHCYTGCGQIGSIYDVVAKVFNIEFTEAFLYVCNFFNIRNTGTGLDFNDKSDNSFISKFKKKEDLSYSLKIHNREVLNHFDKLYHKTWLDDYITIETMKLFDIRFDILNNRVIIPHFDIDGNLIGIRCRNFNELELIRNRKYVPISINDKLYNYPVHANFYGIHLVKKAIKKYKKVILVESEKAVMQMYSYYGEDSIAIACSGSSIGSYQIQMLLALGVETVIIAMDKDFHVFGDNEDLIHRRKIGRAFVDKLSMYFNIEIIWDNGNLIGYKDAPTDRGKCIWEKLYENRLLI